MTGVSRSRLLVVISTMVLMVAAVEALELGFGLIGVRETPLPPSPAWALCTGTIDLVRTSVPTIVWSFGAALGLTIAIIATASAVRQIAGTGRLAAELAQSEVMHAPEALRTAVVRADLTYRIRLTDSSDFSAFCIGLISPEIWVSTRVLEQLPPDELEAVLRHEVWHARRRDPLKVLMANAIRAAFFVLPAVQESARSYVIARELDADADTIREMHDSYPLASALYRAIDTGLSQNQPQAAVGAFTTIDARIDQLVGDGRSEPLASRARSFGQFVDALGAVLAVAAGCALVLAA